MSIPIEVAGLVALVPVLSAAHSLKIKAIEGGLSNVNYLAVADGKKYVVRVASDPEGAYGIDRRREQLAAQRAATAGLTPEVIAFFVPEGSFGCSLCRERTAPLVRAVQLPEHDCPPGRTSPLCP